MKTHTQDEIDDRFEKLPKVLQDALFDPKIAQKIFAIGDQFELTIEQIGFLAEETGFVMLGLTRPNMFKDAIQERLGTDNAKGESIAHEINNQIFFPLRETLKSSLGMDIVQEKISMEAMPPPPHPQVPVAPQEFVPRPPERQKPPVEDIIFRGDENDKNKGGMAPKEEEKPKGQPMPPPASVTPQKSQIPFFNIRPIPKEPLPRRSEIPKKLEIMPGGGMMSIPTMPLNHKPVMPQEKTDTSESKKPLQETLPEEKREGQREEKSPPLRKNDAYKEPIE